MNKLIAVFGDDDGSLTKQLRDKLPSDKSFRLLNVSQSQAGMGVQQVKAEEQRPFALDSAKMGNGAGHPLIEDHKNDFLIGCMPWNGW
jgi:hypothetical protein